MKAELRYYSGLEIRSNGSGSRTVVGYALKFNVLSQDLGGFYEKIDSRALEGADFSDVVALFNHDNNLILSRTASNTLKLTPDSIGLRYEFEAPNTTAGNDLLESIKRGDITGSSFSFIVAKGGDTWTIPDKYRLGPYSSFQKSSMFPRWYSRHIKILKFTAALWKVFRKSVPFEIINKT